MKGNVSSTMNSRPQPPPPPPQSNRSQLVAPSVPGRATPMVPPPRQNRSNDIAVAPRIPDRNEGYAINTPPPPPPPQFSSNRPNQPHNPSISNAPQGNVRVDLMAAIQGGHQLKERTPKPQPKEEEEEIEEPEDLAAAIRAALDARKGALMDSGINI